MLVIILGVSPLVKCFTEKIFKCLFTKVLHLCIIVSSEREVHTMPTNKPRLNMVLDESELERIEHYRYLNGINSMSKAATELVLKGLAKLDSKVPATEPYTREELHLLHIYRKAGTDGKAAIMSAALKTSPAKAKSRTLHAEKEDFVNTINIDHIGIFLDYYRSLDEDAQNAFILSILKRMPFEEDIEARLDAADEEDESVTG